MKKQNS
jgi:hypothetical protein